MFISELPRLWTSWPGSLGRVGQLMVGPLFPSFESRRLGTHGTKPRQQPPSAWQASLGLDYSNLPFLAKLLSALLCWNN
jgi:hypothetical protein